MTLPFVSIIVVNYNLKTFLKELLRGLLQTEYPSFEILFVDNASTDQSVEYVRRNFQDKRLRIIAFDDNLGLYKAQNWAAKHAEGEYLCFMDADVKVSHNWLLPMVEIMIEDKSVGATQPLITQMENSLAHAGKPELEKDFVEIREISYPRGACTLVRREVFERLQGFDEDLFYQYGDCDLGWRSWLYGYRCLLVSAAKIYHAGRKKGSEEKESTRQARTRLLAYHVLKNRIAMELKFVEVKTLPRLTPFLLVRESMFAAVNRRHWKSTVKAVLWVIRNMRLTMRKRSIIQYERIMNDAAFKNRFPQGELIIFGRDRKSARPRHGH